MASIVKYYIAPFTPLFAKGGGKFGLSEPGRPTGGSKCLIYGSWDQSRGTRCSSIIPFGPNGIGLEHCVTRIEGPSQLHTDIASDSSILALPITPDNKNSRVQDLDSNERIAMTERLESLKIDTSWITDQTRLKEVLRYIVNIVLVAQNLGGAYPNIDLSKKVTEIPDSKRNATVNLLRKKNIDASDINADSNVRDIVSKFGRTKWGDIIIGPDIFNDN